METRKLISSIGIMSGTSMDGLDIALIQSDGRSIIKNKKFSYIPFDEELRRKILHLIESNPSTYEIKKIENEFTLRCVELVNKFLLDNNIDRSDVDIISFSGHTILHDPSELITWQIGNPDLIEAKTGIRTISNFRSYDVARNGQGAPLAPIYHYFMVKDLVKTVAVLNIGGVNNLTYIPNDRETDIVAFDICFGNAPFDDLMSKFTDYKYDQDGAISLSGSVNEEFCDRVLKNEIFYRSPPKSFDRNDFRHVISPIYALDLPDALASLSYIHAKVVAANVEIFLAARPRSIFVCGGGVKNKSLMGNMRKVMPDIEIRSTSHIGFNPDQIEAQAFAFLGIRKYLGMPISFQKTTGILPENDFFPASSRR